MIKHLLLYAVLWLNLPTAKGQLTPIKTADSSELVSDIVESFCDNLENSIKKGNVSPNDLGKFGIAGLFQQENMIAIKNLSGDYSVDMDTTTFDKMEKGFRIALRACLDGCRLVDTFLGYDGRQRPAYAHFNQAICHCISDKKAQFQDPALALLKFGYIRDSCMRAIFTDPDQLKIAYTANDFKSKAEIDRYDQNFQGYFFKNCSESFENLIFICRQTCNAMLQDNQKSLVTEAAKLDYSRNETIKPLLHLFTSTLGGGSKSKTSDLFTSLETHKNALPAINLAKARLKNYAVLDYLPNMTQRSDGITEYRFTIYQYLPKAKKRNILCQLLFEFEGTSELVAAFRYIEKGQIANLGAFEKILSEMR